MVDLQRVRTAGATNAKTIGSINNNNTNMALINDIIILSPPLLLLTASEGHDPDLHPGPTNTSSNVSHDHSTDSGKNDANSSNTTINKRNIRGTDQGRGQTSAVSRTKRRGSNINNCGRDNLGSRESNCRHHRRDNNNNSGNNSQKRSPN